MNSEEISRRLSALKTDIAAACHSAGRAPEAVRLLAMSKAKPASMIRCAYECGQSAFGENYVQEARQKMAALADLDIEWHFTGPLQSNKTAEIAANFDWVHGVDRVKIARRLSAARSMRTTPLNICVQINISGESSKSGCAPSEALELCKSVNSLPALKLRGLMAIPAPGASTPQQPYLELYKIYTNLQSYGLKLDTLSAGMSDDFVAAIAQGATVVRIGSAIFGSR